TVGQYRMATGYECIIGYIYLEKHYDRMLEITKMILSMPEPDENKEKIAEKDKYEEDTVTVDGE
ncbi:hypothetical protein NE701_15210, partial [Coprococcus eutactus]|nr:hypothetical protein [Coprococcus eutactus]